MERGCHANYSPYSMAVRQLDVQSTSGQVATGKGGDRGSNPLWTTPNNPTRLGNVWDTRRHVREA